LWVICTTVIDLTHTGKLFLLITYFLHKSNIKKNIVRFNKTGNRQYTIT